MMAFEEKLLIIEEELKHLNEYCKSKGFTPVQLEASAKPLLDFVSQDRHERRKKHFAKISFFFLFLLAMFYIDPVYRTLCCVTKLAAIQILPLFDWTVFSRDPCLMRNPYYIGNVPLDEDCKMCESLQNVARHKNISQAVFMSDYIHRDRPVIINDAIEEWPAKKKFNMQFLSQIFKHEEVLNLYMPCKLQTNVRTRNFNVPLILHKGAKGEISDWYANWENCATKTSKFMRQFYSKPYFLPTTTELERENWLYVANSYAGKLAKPVDVAAEMILFAQIRGSSKVELKPREPCQENCSTLHAKLYEGEILVYTDFLWLMDYLPLDGSENIALGFGGFFMKE